jgi:UDP-N-acetylglucosamine 2-epimerase (non-hydrolysing)
MKLLFVCGARPNFMKIAPLVRACKKYNIAYKIVHTGQHYSDSMSKVFFDELQIPEPDYNLNVGSGSHAKQTSKIMYKFENVCKKEKPEIVVVVGDVNSTLACSIVVSKMPDIKLAHVESGLRSFDREMPEEINRIVTDVLSDYLFCTDYESSKYLHAMKDVPGEIFVPGDVMIDNLLHYIPLIEENVMGDKPYVLATIHRASNTDNKERLTEIIKSLKEVAISTHVIFPMHPRTKKMISEFGLKSKLKPIEVLPPLSYIDFLKYLKYASVVVTDSGSLQIETTVLNKRCLTVRDNTERRFTLYEGTNSLVKPKDIYTGVMAHMISSVGLTHRLTTVRRELLDGNAAERIIRVFL